MHFINRPAQRRSHQSSRYVFERLRDRARQGTIIRNAGWSQSNADFGRCHFCGGTSLRGICQSCGSVVECAWCGRVKLPDGSYAHIGRSVGDHTSHGICPACKADEMAKMHHARQPVQFLLSPTLS